MLKLISVCCCFSPFLFISFGGHSFLSFSLSIFNLLDELIDDNIHNYSFKPPWYDDCEKHHFFKSTDFLLIENSQHIISEKLDEWRNLWKWGVHNMMCIEIINCIMLLFFGYISSTLIRWAILFIVFSSWSSILQLTMMKITRYYREILLN